MLRHIIKHGIKVGDYYKHQLLKLTDPKCPYFIGDAKDNEGPQQQTCELGNLALWMLLAPDALWNKLEKNEQDQFVTHPDFFQNGVPSLGFYGHFEPAIQPYSCAASSFWMFMNFTALTLPADDPFWSAKENEGFWPELGEKEKITHLAGAGMHLLNYGKSGITELINGKVHDSDPNYARLSYSTAFPWESNSIQGPTAASITLHPFEDGKKSPQFPAVVNLAGFRDGVLYRQIIFEKDKRGGTPAFVDMADIAIPDGQITIRRYRKVSPAILYQGHYGIPHLPAAPKIEARDIDDQ